MPSRLPVSFVACLLLTTGCTVPEAQVEPGAPEVAPEAPPAELAPDSTEVRENIRRIQAAVDDAQGALETVTTAERTDIAVGFAVRAKSALLAGAEGDTETEASSGLMPSQTDTRGDATIPSDLFTETLTIARETRTALGPAVIEILRDPIAGDLGAWQRDPAGMVELARTAAASSDRLEELEQAILELPGEATRAIAWIFVIEDADEVDLAHAAAERAAAHLDLITAALQELPDESTSA